jgi:hypothetical protein
MDGDQKNDPELDKRSKLAWQIDVIAVEGKAELEPKITHFENAI